MHEDTTIYVGVDEHEGSFVVAAGSNREPGVRPAVKLPANLAKLHRFLGKLAREGAVKVCYEAGPAGFSLGRELSRRGWECLVVAPSLIPRRPGERKKTDRRDAEYLALSFRAGQLTFCHMPTEEGEAVRTLVRLRESLKEDAKRTQQRILVEAAHCARHSPAESKTLRARREGQPAGVVAIAVKATKRLSKRYWHLSFRKPKAVAVTAVARELSGFVWAVMRKREVTA